MQIDCFLLEAKKRFDKNNKQQIDHYYVDALLEMNNQQRDQFLKRNIQLNIIIYYLNEQIEKLKRQTTIIPSASQQQFNNPLKSNEEVIEPENQVNHRKNSSILFNEYLSFNNKNDENKEDQLMKLLHQVNEQQAN